MSDYKNRVKNAIDKYYKSQEIEIKPKKSNKKPEQISVKEILIWCKQQQWDMDEIEAKAKFNTNTMRYTGRAASKGFSDLCGNTNNGLAVFIEVKAKGHRSASRLRPEQRVFLTRKIQTGCFAIMADCVEYVERVWKHFLSLSFEDRKVFLLSELPSQQEKQLTLDQKGISSNTDDDLPF